MAGGVVMALLGLWVVLQSTKGPLVQKLGLIPGASSPGSSSAPKPKNVAAVLNPPPSTVRYEQLVGPDVTGLGSGGLP